MHSVVGDTRTFVGKFAIRPYNLLDFGESNAGLILVLGRRDRLIVRDKTGIG